MTKFESFAKAHAQCTLQQMQAAWEGEVSLMCLSRALKRLGWTHKKNSSPTASVTKQSGMLS
jgi:transposase